MQPHDTTKSDTAEWYKNYYQLKGRHHNDLLQNPEVLFQAIAFETSIIRGFNTLVKRAGLIEGLTNLRLLYVGCGSGGFIPTFLRLGVEPVHIYGIDILEDRIAEAKKKFLGVNFTCRDASEMEYLDNFFDIVFESTMFIQLTDATLATRIANEMIRVTKPGGFIMLVDWRYSKPRNPHYRGVSSKMIQNLFQTGTQCEVVSISNGALVPPIGRFLSKRLPSLYFLCQRILPILVGQQTTLLRKKGVVAILKGSADPEKTYLKQIRPEKVRLQLKYVRERSFATDLQIIFCTLRQLLQN